MTIRRILERAFPSVAFAIVRTDPRTAGNVHLEVRFLGRADGHQILGVLHWLASEACLRSLPEEQWIVAVEYTSYRVGLVRLVLIDRSNAQVERAVGVLRAVLDSEPWFSARYS